MHGTNMKILAYSKQLTN